MICSAHPVLNEENRRHEQTPQVFAEASGCDGDDDDDDDDDDETMRRKDRGESL